MASRRSSPTAPTPALPGVRIVVSSRGKPDFLHGAVDVTMVAAAFAWRDPSDPTERSARRVPTRLRELAPPRP